MWTGDKGQWLGALAVLAEKQSLALSIHTGQLSSMELQENLIPSVGLWTLGHTGS